jgi:hypothetical protein
MKPLVNCWLMLPFWALSATKCAISSVEGGRGSESAAHRLSVSCGHVPVCAGMWHVRVTRHQRESDRLSEREGGREGGREGARERGREREVY